MSSDVIRQHWPCYDDKCLSPPHPQRRDMVMRDQPQREDARLAQLDRDKLAAMVEWMAKELSEWIESESVESGGGFDKCRTPEELISDAIAATEH